MESIVFANSPLAEYLEGVCVCVCARVSVGWVGLGWGGRARRRGVLAAMSSREMQETGRARATGASSPPMTRRHPPQLRPPAAPAAARSGAHSLRRCRREPPPRERPPCRLDRPLPEAPGRRAFTSSSPCVLLSLPPHRTASAPPSIHRMPMTPTDVFVHL